MNKERWDGHELLDLWQTQNKVWHFEGDTGIDGLNKLAEALNYRETNFRYGEPVLRFLSDNPGACEALLEWIADNADEGPHHDALVDATNAEDEDDEENEADDEGEDSIARSERRAGA
jgi:hypothetical protein